MCDLCARDIDVTEACDATAVTVHVVADIPLGATRGMSAGDDHGERSEASSTQLKRARVSRAHSPSGLREPDPNGEATPSGSVLRARGQVPMRRAQGDAEDIDLPACR
jgi:hypothetical protein